MKERSLQKKRSFCLFLNKAENRQNKHNDQLLLSALSFFIQHH
ncbi:hypothetical protein CHCC14820_1594 [Bacillus paralicheniformis]|nr:hypothetical protein SC10_B2orf01540 [Bacillus paralicheniformis]OLG06339.1 hypothetical protein B4125_0520 [Bacillus paralicheniformis]TWK45179.1 hypothetical protein CHCC20347_1385 [Bacillus paralicheniformis]TWL99784.1 hypothetical protein CHCC15136_2160 [Bacillus paralicheniformis]TWM30142.1 hypothetical protein CHCC14820_1594 [Bacillus paralicheniformis]